MRYICLGYMEESRFESMSESERDEFMDTSFAYDEEMQKSGHFRQGEALQSVHAATTVRLKGGKLSVTDGPFAETKEALGGITILEAKNLDEAIQIMSKHPSVKFGGTWEIRPAADLAAMIAASRRRRFKSA